MILKLTPLKNQACAWEGRSPAVRDTPIVLLLENISTSFERLLRLGLHIGKSVNCSFYETTWFSFTAENHSML